MKFLILLILAVAVMGSSLEEINHTREKRTLYCKNSNLRKVIATNLLKAPRNMAQLSKKILTKCSEIRPGEKYLVHAQLLKKPFVIKGLDWETATTSSLFQGGEKDSCAYVDATYYILVLRLK